MRKAIVLLSGGQDSTTCLYWAREKFDQIYAIGFDYGQSHRVELSQASKIARDIGIDFKVFDIKGMLSGSSLVDGGDHNENSKINESLPASFTSGRNLIFLSIAGAYAGQVGANDIVAGFCQTDFNGYPDCRRSTMDAMQLSLTLGLGIDDVRINTPLMYLSKAETWKMAKELNCIDIIIRDTITDYNGDDTFNEWGMGIDNNPATKLRKEGYFEAKERGWI